MLCTQWLRYVRPLVWGTALLACSADARGNGELDSKVNSRNHGSGTVLADPEWPPGVIGKCQSGSTDMGTEHSGLVSVDLLLIGNLISLTYVKDSALRASRSEMGDGTSGAAGRRRLERRVLQFTPSYQCGENIYGGTGSTTYQSFDVEVKNNSTSRSFEGREASEETQLPATHVQIDRMNARFVVNPNGSGYEVPGCEFKSMLPMLWTTLPRASEGQPCPALLGPER